MGAEALRTSSSNLDLDELAKELRDEIHDTQRLQPAPQEGDQAPARGRGVPQERPTARSG